MALASVVSATLAGCNEVNELAAEAELTYDGASSGSHSDATTCDADGDIKGDGVIMDGQVRIVVTDADGTRLFDQVYTDSFEIEPRDLDGDSGTWTVSAERSGDDLVGDEFRGEYAIFLNC
jgi:hypothetical protein